MSHFTVLVVGDDHEKQLQKFHEFECTGEDDEYVQDIDETEECRKEYESQTTTKIKSPSGEMFDPYDDQFYREPVDEEEKKSIGLGTGVAKGLSYTSKDWGDGKGYRAKIRFVPEGWEKVEIPTSQEQTFVEFLEDYYGRSVVLFNQKPELTEKHKYGYVLLNEDGTVAKVIDRTNPNRKWDWFQVGGRWAGFFTLKEGAQGTRGAQSWMQKMGGQPYPEGKVDQARKGDIDFDSMFAENMKNAEESWSKYEAEVAEKGIEKVSAYWDYGIKKDETREQYIARKSFPGTFAVLYNGEWYERGSMGWWGAVHDEKEDDIWDAEFKKLLASISDNTLLTVVDCHI